MLEKSMIILINYIEQAKKAEFEKLEKQKKAVKDIKCAEDDEACKEKKKQAEKMLEKGKDS